MVVTLPIFIPLSFVLNEVALLSCLFINFYSENNYFMHFLVADLFDSLISEKRFLLKKIYNFEQKLKVFPPTTFFYHFLIGSGSYLALKN
jgi:hypothetical protein